MKYFFRFQSGFFSLGLFDVGDETLTDLNRPGIAGGDVV
jgi:hypothetical protein